MAILINDHPVFFSSDYIVVGADSGRISILEYNPAKNLFEKVCAPVRVCDHACVLAINVPLSLPPRYTRRHLVRADVDVLSQDSTWQWIQRDEQ